jgi:alginate O-acetyltransferase complex protein AlgI
MWKISLFTSALATLLAMTIAGLWHGPAWTFIVYGVIHGVGLGVNQYWRKKKMPVLPKFVSWLLTFVVVDIALLFFRASDLHSAFRMVAAMVDPRHGLAMPTLHAATQSLSVFSRYVVVGIGVFAAFFWKSSDELSLEFKPTLRYAVAAYSLLVASCLFMVFNVSQDFLYFKF